MGQSVSLMLDSLDPSNPVLSSILDTERGVLIPPMVLPLLCRTITTSSDTSCPPDTVSARLILDSADPPSMFPGSTLDSFLTALDTERGVLTLLSSLLPPDSLPGLPLVDTDTDPPVTAAMDTPLARGVLMPPMVLPLLYR